MSFYSILRSLVVRKLGKYPEEIELASLARNFKHDYGYRASVRAQKPIDAQGKAIPWFTYPAIEYLDSLDLSKANIFEWGSGNSSAYFSDRCLSIESIESDQAWYEYQLTIARHNQLVSLRQEEGDSYPNAINNGQHEAYEIIIVDGKQRVRCCSAAITRLSKEGLIILDNSDWYPMLCDSLRRRNFVQIDFHGHGPINPYTWTTSIFMQAQPPEATKSLLCKRLSDPCYSRSGLAQVADDDGSIDQFAVETN